MSMEFTQSAYDWHAKHDEPVECCLLCEREVRLDAAWPKKR